MKQYIVHALKYATLTLVAAVIVVAGMALFKNVRVTLLTGRLVAPSQNQQLQTMHFEADRAQVGFTIPADINVIFTVPSGVRIPRITFLGGQDLDQAVPYWGYCYSGRENSNKAVGKTGTDLYDGQFFYSLAERKAQEKNPQPTDSGLLGILHSINQTAPDSHASIAEIFTGPKTCYVMTSKELPAAIDTDGDDLNNKREQLLGTSPNSSDADHDGIGDGTEVFVTKTSPLQADTDRDGLTDRCEDKNMNGFVDHKETSALNPDTDRDTLCDGNGSSSACPEAKEVVCTNDWNGERTCESRPTSPVFGEDMNQNCVLDEGETDPTDESTFGSVNDWDYKWNLLGGAPRPGIAAPVFPIPELPRQTSENPN